jgi:hypothetical protein
MGLAGLSGCCLVCPASDAALLDVGFRSPEQAFRTLQTAVRADEPGLEFRCLSGGFRRAFDPPLSRLSYLEARHVMHRENRWLRTGIARALIDSVEHAHDAGGLGGSRRALIRATSFGRRIEIDLVQEDYAELWALDPDEPVLEREIAFPRHVDVQAAADGAPWVTAGVPLPAGVAAQAITELRLGREWKIDGFREVDDDERGARP